MKHGFRRRGSRTPEYACWESMIQRCTDPNFEAYHNYGGRGIKVCERWRYSFENFLADMGPRPEGKTLDRIDDDGDYEPGNCRWATWIEQGNNRRTNKVLEYRGIRKTIAEWARETGLSYETIRSRLNHGWSVERALTALIQKKGNGRKSQRNSTAVTQLPEFGGARRSLTEWSQETGIPLETLRTRIKMGWPLQRALTEPVQAKRRRR